MIVLHTKKKSGVPHRCGTLVANISDDKVVRIGFAKCKLKMDMFDPAVGVDLSCERIKIMEAKGNRLPTADSPFPDSLILDTKKFIIRAMRYFKTENIKVFRWTDEAVAAVIADWKATKAA